MTDTTTPGAGEGKRCAHKEVTNLGIPECPVIWCPNCGAVQQHEPKRGWAVPDAREADQQTIAELRKALARIEAIESPASSIQGDKEVRRRMVVVARKALAAIAATEEGA